MRKAANLSILLMSALFILLSGCEKKKKVNYTTLTINSIPQGAVVSIDGKELSTTPVTVKITPGKHIIKAEKQEFLPKWTKVLCSPGATAAVEIPMDPITASTLIESTPQGAEVIIRGESVGETPLVLYNQSLGPRSAILKKIGAVNKEISWEITDDRPRYIKETLSSNLGNLIIRTEPSNATISIDGKPRGNTPFSAPIEEGNHSIKISMSGYSGHEQSILVLRDKTLTKNISLQLLPGSVTISSSPPGAFVYVNDKQYENTPCEIKDLKPGNYKLKIQRPGYDPSERDFSIRPGQKTTVSINLDSNTGRIQLVTCPAGISIYIDGKFLGKTEKGEHKDVSKVFEVDNVSMGSHTLTLVHKLAKPNTKSFTLKINKGETKRLKNIRMWIADTELLLRDGKRYVGRLETENDQAVMFEIEPGVTQHYDKSEIKSMKTLEYKEE
ncbi:MAG: hypothetical protein A2020_05090 [Lentisphaerae bacterium GWF2_45_14]|nr:MAG: hypothetical protein A2020_05090 [Lentisphaerae bacterium GWF2_45_14]